MTVEEILSAMYSWSVKIRTVPSAHDRRIQTLVRECNRKIGSWRKGLFLAGVIPDERKRRYPQLLFRPQGKSYALDPYSRKRLRRICPENPSMKERVL